MTGPGAGVQSMLTGTIGLQIAFLAALGLGLSRPRLHSGRPLVVASLVTLAMQALHFTEEYSTGFATAFPMRLGLAPWSDTFFIVFNVGWIALWAFAIATADRLPRAAAVLLWFLAIAAIVNGVAHPLLAVAAKGYFPGLWTAPVLGLAGLWLAKNLRRATHVPRPA